MFTPVKYLERLIGYQRPETPPMMGGQMNPPYVPPPVPPALRPRPPYVPTTDMMVSDLTGIFGGPEPGNFRPPTFQTYG